MTEATVNASIGVRTPAQSDSSRSAFVCAAAAILIANVALTLPTALTGSVQQHLGATGSQITWYSALFGAATALSGLSFAVLGDLRGRKRIILAGFGLLVIGSLISMLAGSVHVLWVGQAVAGLGGGALYTSSLAVIVTSSRTPEARARAIAVWSLALALGTALGPLLAGGIAGTGSWRSSYAPVIALAVIAAVACARFMPESTATERRSFDWVGQALIALVVIGVCYGSISGSTNGWGSGSAVGSFAGAAVLLVGFLVHESRHHQPLLRLSLFRSSAFSSAAFVAVVGMTSFIGVIYILSLLFGIADHLSAWNVALRVAPNSLMTLLLFPVLRRWLSQVSGRWLLGLGVLPLAAGELWLAQLSVGASYAQVIGPILLIGIGFAFLVTSLTSSAVNSVPIQVGGMAAGTSETLRLIGQTLGIAVIGAIGLSRADSYLGRKLAVSKLPSPAMHVVQGVAAHGGVIAVASAPLGPISHVVAPLAVSALVEGLHAALVVSAIALIVAAASALLFLRDHPDRLVLVDPEG
jgi:MFS family permease